MDSVLSRRLHLPGRIVCDRLSRRKAWGLLLSGLTAVTTAIPLELDPFFMLPDNNFTLCFRIVRRERGIGKVETKYRNAHIMRSFDLN